MSKDLQIMVKRGSKQEQYVIVYLLSKKWEYENLYSQLSKTEFKKHLQKDIRGYKDNGCL